MRHGNKLNHLGRKSAHRKAMISNMACSLIQHKRINTTLAKAKALRVFVEPLLTKSKTDSTHSRRVVFSYLQNKEIVTELFRDIAPKIAERNGGYTRIIRTGYRLGDNAEMCMIELVDFNEIYNTDRTKKTTRRSRRGGSGAAKETSSNDSTNISEDAVEVIEPSAEVAVEEVAVVEETPVVEEVAAVEETPAVEEVVAVEETPVVEEVAAIEETPAVEEVVAVEETPAVEEVVAVEETPAVEEVAAVEETPTVDEAPSTDETSASEDSAADEEEPKA
ncbi:MAG: 50S ribosomal protein L17 [Cryomorphaceae bacterium]|nr:50S ribosomal protein L17 [Cryomorphaceae bacterium]